MMILRLVTVILMIQLIQMDIWLNLELMLELVLLILIMNEYFIFDWLYLVN